MLLSWDVNVINVKKLTKNREKMHSKKNGLKISKIKFQNFKQNNILEQLKVA